jgi:LCP family protein required for cell wall assembly
MSSHPEYLDYADDAPARGHRGLWWRILGWFAVAMAAVLVMTSLAAYAAYRKFEGNITHQDVSSELGTHRPPKLNNAMNILMIGSDSRAGANSQYGYVPGARSDTIMLLHIAPGGQKAVGISFPRDSMVQIPSCKLPNGKTVPGGLNLINAAFDNGGAGCTWHTIETLTGIRIDHFVQVDFSGFKRITDALGGVTICLPKAVHDKAADLDMSAGYHTVKGAQALAYVRERHDLGDGSDIGRIARQQEFLGSVVKKATSTGVLTSPSKLYNFLDAATKSVTLDKDFTIDGIEKLASSVKGMSAGKVKFVTVPWEAYPTDPNRIQWAQPQAGELFDAIKSDNQVVAPAAPVKKATVPPAQVQVRVENATNTTGLAARIASQLTARGYKVTKTTTYSGTAPSKTEIVYGAGADAKAATLAGIVPNATPQAATTGTPAGVVDLVLGPDWTNLKGAAAATIPKSVATVNATDNLCKH